MTVPIGTILPYGGAVDGNNKGILASQGWLVCNGDTYTRDEYPDLGNVIGNQFGGDSTNKFYVPDLRGRFVRGVDGEANRDPDHDSRKASGQDGSGNTGNKVGSVQEDKLKDHNHVIIITGDRSPFAYKDGTPINQSAPDTRPQYHGNKTGNTEKTIGSLETRPKNIYVNWIIKAKNL